MMCSQRARQDSAIIGYFSPHLSSKVSSDWAGGFGVDGEVDGLEIGGDALAVLVFAGTFSEDRDAA
jgi:hypothetical protein